MPTSRPPGPFRRFQETNRPISDVIIEPSHNPLVHLRQRMSVCEVPSKNQAIRAIPQDVWLHIFDHLSLANMVLVSKTCPYFKSLIKESMLAYDHSNFRFQKVTKFICEGVSMEPTVHPESGIVAFFNDQSHSLQICDLARQATLIFVYVPDSTPASMKFSPSGKYIALLFDSMVRIYELLKSEGNDRPNELCLAREVKFDVLYTGLLTAEGDVPLQGIGRVLVEFSPNETSVSIAHAVQSPNDAAHISINSLTISLIEDEYFEEMENPFEEDERGVMLANDMITFQLQFAKEGVTVWDIHMNAHPLRFIVPPGCIDSSGFFIDPRGMTDEKRCLHFHYVDMDHGRLLNFSFSRCGRYYVGTRMLTAPGRIVLSVSKYQIITTERKRCVQVSLVAPELIVDVLLSKEAEMAVVLVGRGDREDIEITGWFVINLEQGGYFFVAKREAIDFSYLSDSRAFSLSGDGQLISIATLPRDDRNHMCDVKVYVTATGYEINRQPCMSPNPADMRYRHWDGYEGLRYFQVLGGKEKATLTYYTLSDEGVIFYHAH